MLIGVGLPTFLQILFVVFIIMITNGTGSFVGLGALVLGIFALPITALINWLVARTAMPKMKKFILVTIISAIFPGFLLFLYVVTS